VRRLPLVCCVALLLLSAVACDAFGDDVAATVEGHDIPVSSVTTLAREPAFNQGQSAGTDSVLAGDVGRGALTLLIQFQLTANELERRGASVTSEDQDTVDQTYGSQLSSLKPDVRAILTKGLAEQAALSRVLKGIDPSSPTEQAELYARARAYHQLRCFEGLVAPTTGEIAIATALRSGQSIDDIVAKGVGGATAGFGQGEQCVPRDAKPNFPAKVLSLIYDSKPGSIHGAVVQGSQGDVAVIVAVTRDRTIGPNDPYLAQLLQSVQQGGIESWLPLVQDNADVRVNPQYGRGFTTATGVVAPVTPPVPGALSPDANAQPAA
jgi:hypothetical protein